MPGVPWAQFGKYTRNAAGHERRCAGLPAPGIRPAMVWLRVIVGATIMFYVSVACWGQATTGRIVGTVTDPSHAVLPGSTITAANASTRVVGRTTSDDSGRYRFLSLAAGRYSVTASPAAFSATGLANITLHLYQTLTFDIALKVGTSQGAVNVQAAPTLVDTTNASLGTIVGDKSIVDLPLNLREVGSLALLVPGTVNTTGCSLATGAANGPGFNDLGYGGPGGGWGGNLVLIDGMISRAPISSSFALDPPPEMVKEFKIQNNAYDASFGLASGTVMNLITNSGTDQTHGAA
jgi:hypothetical protein